MRTKEFVMRGQTASDSTEILNFSGFKPGYAYKITQFKLYPSTNLGTANFEGCASITAAKTAMSPISPDFNNEGLIATAYSSISPDITHPAFETTVIDDTFLITQNLILKVKDTHNGTAVNWQCKFMPVKMNGSESAVANYKQFTISDGS